MDRFRDLLDVITIGQQDERDFGQGPLQLMDALEHLWILDPGRPDTEDNQIRSSGQTRVVEDSGRSRHGDDLRVGRVLLQPPAKTMAHQRPLIDQGDRGGSVRSIR
jgi:hypothetical protein